MNHFHEGIDELTGKNYLPDEFINYKADIEYPLPMIYQSGYLTIKDYDKESNLFLLDFPNNEERILGNGGHKLLAVHDSVGVVDGEGCICLKAGTVG